MPKRTAGALASAVLLCVLAACSRQSSTDTSATPGPDGASAAAASPSAAAAPAGDAAASPAADAAASAPATGAAAGSGGAQVSYTDVAGALAAPQIHDLAVLGVFDSTSGAFHPLATITRGEFVEWLVKANNAIYGADPAKQIRLAEGTTATFPDVPAGSPYFKYVQGMNDAGYAVGFGDKLFHPDDTLTREQLLALKIGVDAGQVPNRSDSDMNSEWNYVPNWTDKATIEKRYRPAFIEGYYSYDKFGNTGRIWGTLKTLGALKPVTREDAALAVSSFYPHDQNGSPTTAAQAVAKLAAATPTP